MLELGLAFSRLSKATGLSRGALFSRCLSNSIDAEVGVFVGTVVTSSVKAMQNVFCGRVGMAPDPYRVFCKAPLGSLRLWEGGGGTFERSYSVLSESFGVASWSFIGSFVGRGASARS